MKRIFLAAAVLLGLATSVSAQTQPGTATVVATCGSGVTYTSGRAYPVTQNTSGQGCSISSGGTSTANTATTAAAPTYVNGTSNPISTDVHGSTRSIILDSTGAAVDYTLPSPVKIDQTTPGTTNGVQVNAALPAGGNVIGAVTQSGTWTVQPGNTPNSTPWLVTLQPTTSGGSSTYSANVTNTALAVDASPGQIYGYFFYNGNSSVCYVQLWDLATGSVTVGTTAPKLSLGIPANGGANVAFPNGIPFAVAISIAATTARAGASACTSGVDSNVLYK